MASNVTADFGLELFHNLVAVTPRCDNIIISTYGIMSALSMLLLGTKGKSEEDLSSLLTVKKDNFAAYHRSVSSLATSLNSPSLSSANRLFVRKNLDLVASFLSETQQYYNSIAEKVDFAGSPAGTQAQINDWVKARTHDKIPKLLNEPLDALTAVFLVNAVHFKDKWRYPFESEHTFPGTFHISGQESVKCDMMMLVENTENIRLGNSDELDCQLVELPYEGEFSMLIILPFVAEKLPDVEKKVTGAVIREEMKNLHAGLGPEIYLPRFKIEFETSLKEALEKMGGSSLFDQRANLTGMIDACDVAVSDVIHKAVIEVNEEGTEAAGATGVGIMALSLPPQIRVDHPFLFAIVHRPTATPIFFGRLSKPSPVTVQ